MLTVRFKSGAVVGPIYVERTAPWKCEDICDIIEVQADGHELEHIQSIYPNLPRHVTSSSLMGKANTYKNTQRWFGIDAKYAASCWQAREFTKPLDLPEPINKTFSELYQKLSDQAAGKLQLSSNDRQVIYTQLRWILSDKERGRDV